MPANSRRRKSRSGSIKCRLSWLLGLALLVFVAQAAIGRQSPIPDSTRPKFVELGYASGVMHAMESGDSEQLKAWSEAQIPPATKEYVLAGYYRTIFQIGLSNRHAKACYDQSSDLSVDHHLGLALSCGELLAGNYRIVGRVADWARTMQAVQNKVYGASAHTLHDTNLVFYGFKSGNNILDMKSFMDFPAETISSLKNNMVIPRVLGSGQKPGADTFEPKTCRGAPCEGQPYYVKVDVNGHDVVGILDTGANPASAIPVSEISRLGVHMSSSPYYPSRSGTGGFASDHLGYVKSISIPTQDGSAIVLRNVPVTVGGQFPSGLGIVLGLNVISKFGSLLLEQQGAVVHPDASGIACKVPLRIASTLPGSSFDILFKYPIDGHPQNIFLDTGSSEFLVGTAGAVAERASTQQFETSETGVTGASFEKFYPAKVRFDSGADAKDLSIRVYITPHGPYPYAMGAEFLQEYKILLDFERGTGCLIPAG